MFDLNNHRGEGRTYIIAVATIRRAILYPGTPVPIWDHYYNRQSGGFRGAAYQNLRARIEQLIGEDPDLSRYAWEFPNREELLLVTPSMTDALPWDWLPVSMRATPEETLAQSILEEEDARILKEIGRELVKKSSWDIIADDDEG